MKEAFFILLVVAVLLGLTAIRYRRQIVGFISFYKQLKAAQTNLRKGGPRSDQPEVRGIQLVKCAHCGKWVPESEISGSVCRSGCSAISAN